MAKRSKASVAFEHPAKGPHHCGQCKHFDPPDECRLVMGTIRPRDWCRLFQAKSAGRDKKQAAHLNEIAGKTDAY